MNRRTPIVSAIALLTAIGTANLGRASDPEFEQPDGRSQQAESGHPDERSQQAESTQPEGRDEWRERLLTANQEVASAQKRSAAALSAYRTMRHRRHPRGDARQAIMDEVEISREALATAQQDLESLERAARHAGAPPSWLKFDPAEIEAATQVPASQQPYR